MTKTAFEKIGTAFDKHTDDGEFVVYRCVGQAALYICGNHINELPVDSHIDTRDRTGSGFAKTVGSEPVFEKGEYAHYKGGAYTVGGLALRTDSDRDNDWWVVYTAVYDKQLYARPLGGFVDFVRLVDQPEPVQRFRKTENTAHE